MDSPLPAPTRNIFSLRRYRYDIVAVYLFGTWATDDQPTSDVAISILR